MKLTLKPVLAKFLLKLAPKFGARYEDADTFATVNKLAWLKSMEAGRLERARLEIQAHFICWRL